MEEIQCCYKCGIGFRQVGFLSLGERLEDHEQIPHVIKCGECEDFFISYCKSHLRNCGNVLNKKRVDLRNVECDELK